MIDRRRGLMGQERGRLPEGYTKIAYIQADTPLAPTATTWNRYGAKLNTGVVRGTANEIEIQFKYRRFSSAKDAYSFAGTFLYVNQDAVPLYCTTNIWSIFGSIKGSLNWDGTVIEGLIRWNEQEHSYYAREKFSTGSTLSVTNTLLAVSFAADEPIIVFGSINPDSATHYHDFGQLYWLKIKVGGRLVRNYIPCIQQADNAVGMYDLISKQFYKEDPNLLYTNGGVFTAGPII